MAWYEGKWHGACFIQTRRSSPKEKKKENFRNENSSSPAYHAIYSDENALHFSTAITFASLLICRHYDVVCIEIKTLRFCIGVVG